MDRFLLPSLLGIGERLALIFTRSLLLVPVLSILVLFGGGGGGGGVEPVIWQSSSRNASEASMSLKGLVRPLRVAGILQALSFTGL